MKYTMVLILITTIVSGCGDREVMHPEETETIELSGLWNDVDARKISDEMTLKITESTWIVTANERLRRKPIIKFGGITVRMDDGSIVNTSIFVNAMRKSLINTGKVVIKADTTKTRAELEEQSNYAKEGKEMGLELAPDYLITGKISCQNDQVSRTTLKYIVADFEIVDVQSGEIIWTDRATPIKKLIKQDSFK